MCSNSYENHRKFNDKINRCKDIAPTSAIPLPISQAVLTDHSPKINKFQK